MAAQLDTAIGTAPLAGGAASYRVYPSLLDKYQSLLDYEDEAEQPWNRWHSAGLGRARAEAAAAVAAAKDSLSRGLQGLEEEIALNALEQAEGWRRELEAAQEGDYVLTPERMYEKIQAELVAQINREPREPSEAADKGTALNEAVDCMLMGVPSTRGDVKLSTVRDACGEPYAVRALMDGFCFDFDVSLCRALRDELRGSLCQKFLSAPISTSRGAVELYGYSDYMLLDKIVDLKTTSSYDFGKYERKWQRRVYPYCALESGAAAEVSEFVYLVARLGKGRLICGELFAEAYGYDHSRCSDEIRGVLESFLGWLESPEIRPLVTDQKIFNRLED